MRSTKAAGVAGTNGQIAVSRASSMIGGRYVWDAERPKTRTFDCSGLSMWCYAPFKKLEHSAAIQFTQLHHRPFSEAEPGDLVFFGHTAASIFHVGIYVGGGQMISALDPAEGIKRTPVPTTARIPLVGVCPGGATKAAGGHVSVAEAMLEALRSNPLTKRLSAAADAAIIGNADVESGDNPAAYNAREGAMNLFQFEGGRGAGLEAYAKAHHESKFSFDAGIGYMFQELGGSKHYVLDELMRGGSATELAHDWQRDYEGSSVDSLPAREAAARARYAQIKGGKPLESKSHADTATLTGDTFLGIPNPLNAAKTAASALNPADWVKAAESIGPRIVSWAADALIVVVGLALVVLALYLAAKSTGQDVSLNANQSDEHKPGGHKDAATGAGAAAADSGGAAADAALLA